MDEKYFQLLEKIIFLEKNDNLSLFIKNSKLTPASNFWEFCRKLSLEIEKDFQFFDISNYIKKISKFKTEVFKCTSSFINTEENYCIRVKTLFILKGILKKEKRNQSELYNIAIEADVLFHQYQQKSNKNDLLKGTSLFRSIFDDLGFYDLPLALKNGIWTNSASCFITYYKVFNDDLYLRISLCNWESVLEKFSPYAEYYHNIRGNYGSGLIALYEKTGEINKLSQAVDILRNSADHLERGAVNRGTIMNFLGNALSAEIIITCGKKPIDEAIYAYKEALWECNFDPVVEAELLHNLGTEEVNKYILDGDQVTLDKAIVNLKKSLKLAEPDARHVRTTESGLAGALISSYEVSNKPEILDEATSYALASISNQKIATDDRRCSIAALCFSKKYDFYHKRKYLFKTISFYRRAISSALVYRPNEALKYSNDWLVWAFNREAWKEVVSAYKYLNKALEFSINVQLQFEDKELIVQIVNTAVSKAAFSYAKLGKSEKSVLCLENGLSKLLHSLVLPKEQKAKFLLDGNDDKYSSWKNIKNNDLLNFSPSSTLIYISPTIKGCLIGIVQNVKISTILIESLSTINIIEQVIGRGLDKKELLNEISLDGYLSSYINWQKSSFEKTEELIEAESEWQEKLTELSEWLWKELFEKIVCFISNERVVFLPYGNFSFLPLHISKYSNSKYIINKFNISYLPCIGFHNEERGSTNNKPAGHMITNDFDTSGSLTFINFEKEILKKYFPTTSLIRSISELSSKLSKSNIVHLSGHGRTDLYDPLSSNIDIFDKEHLKISDCFNIDFSSTELMVLSACETGLRGFGADGEALSFSTALMRCGVSRVIASMWVVRDDITTLQMVYFYYIYHKFEITAIEAFWQSQKWLIETTNEEKITFIRKVDATSKKSSQAKLELINRLKMDKSLDFSHPFNWAGFYFSGV